MSLTEVGRGLGLSKFFRPIVGLDSKSVFFRHSGESRNPGFSYSAPPPLDAGLRRHDGLFLRLTPTDLKHSARYSSLVR